MPKILDKKNVEMLTSHGIFTESEITSRCDIMLENYTKTVNIEAQTMIDMAKKQILPALSKFTGDLAKQANAKSGMGSGKYETRIVSEVSGLMDKIDEAVSELEKAVSELRKIDTAIESSAFVRDEILPKMDALREPADKAEQLTSEEYWPFPTYDKLLFGVR